MAANPAEAGAGGPVLVADGDGVAAAFPFDAQPLAQGEEHLLDVLVIIPIFCVCSHLLPLREILGNLIESISWISRISAGGGEDIIGWGIGADAADDALGAGDEQARIHALVGIAGHIVEVAVPAAAEPLAQGVFLVGEGVGAGDAAVVEPHG